MEFKFDANQEFQVRAIEAVTDLFKGQARIEAELTFALGAGFAAVANRLDLEEHALLENLQAVQAQNGIRPDGALQCIEETIEAAAGPRVVRFPNFSVEMETGTGKTYVYIRTALELFRRYGLRKFIIVVPSVAIREGVLKTLQITEKHLKEFYSNVPYRYFVYDSENLSQVRQFAISDSVQLMVMTIDSFNKASNVIRQSTDRLQGETPIYLVQTTRPVLILDEPQNMESELRVKALSALGPLFALRYSATHRNPYNVVYRLSPFEAYRQGLVKRIEVDSVVKETDANQVFLRLGSIATQKKTVTACIAIHKLMKDGTVKEKAVAVRPGDSLQEKADRSDYAGFEIAEINPGGRFARFANNAELKVGEARGADKEAIFEAQIRSTLEEHFRKQAKLRQVGIKVLSLFFIDRVDNYAHKDGVIRKLFVKAFNEIRARYPEWRAVDPEKAQAAYFAKKQHKGGVTELIDSVSGKTKEDEEAYDLIMKDKERLLSLDEPVAFIFSHSALREGWDNPNVFQICTLNQTASEIKKRQEVGRGVRLAVDQSGSRVHDEQINILTVVANESYERYVETLQSEIAFEYREEIEARYGKPIGSLSDEERRSIEEEYGQGLLPPKPPRADRPRARLRKVRALSPEFKELWERIKHKTRYAVKIDTERLVNEVVSELEKEEIKPPRVTVTKAQVQVSQEGAFTAIQTGATQTALSLVGRYSLPNLVEIMADLMEHTTPPVRITRRTLLDIFKRAENSKAAVDNPHEFATVAVRILKEKLADHLVDGIQYEKTREWYEMSQILDEEEVELFSKYIVRVDNALYDLVPCDSDVEKEFVKELEGRDDVKLYLKLPSWFKVPTPVGEYNPDWAVVMQGHDGKTPERKPLLYLVRETKAEDWRSDLRPDERRKIRCGERHFQGALGVDYKVVSSAGGLP